MNNQEEYFFMHKDNKILVSKEHYNHLKQFKLYVKKVYAKKETKYVSFKIKGKHIRLHRYIMSELMKQEINQDLVVDHINNNPLDNRIENLRILTKAENSRNRLKKHNTSSKYYGVSFCKSKKKWLARLTLQNTNREYIYGYFDDELCAAYQYDLWVKEFQIKIVKINNIEKPKNFIPYKLDKTPRLLPVGVIEYKNSFGVTAHVNKQKYYFTAKTLEEAIKIKETFDKTKKSYKNVIHELKVKFTKIKNNDGNYVYILKNKEVIIDKETYDLMYKFNWSINRNYVIATINNKRLSRIIMKCDDPNLIVDHINGNTLDNRKCNLRIVTEEQNAMNKSPQKNCTSKYIGVCWIKKSLKWSASIYVNGKRLHLGEFDREQDAALARDYATKKYFKECGKLNFPERPGWDEYFMNIAEAVKLRSSDYHKVGGVLVSLKNKRIISTGYNSFATGLDDNVDWSNREKIYEKVIHAEMNVLLYSQSKFEDAVMYITTSPCKDCLKLMSASNIKKIIYKHEYREIENVQKLAKELGIELIEYVNIR